MGISRKKIVVIGGGIAGLSAAFYTQKLFGEQQIPVEITIVEKGQTLGGKIRTLHRDGFIIERGPDSFMARKLPMITLTKELGLEEELTATNPKAKTNYILHKGRLHQMPLGLILGVPTEITPFMKTGLLSPLGKARAALDLLLPKKQNLSDESLGSFIERRLGREVLEQISEPLLAGIYAGDTKHLSLQATFPQFVELEKKYRSLILGMLAGKKKPSNNNEGLPAIAKGSLFLTYKKGLTTVVDYLTKALDTQRITTGVGVVGIKKEGQGYQINLDEGSELQADGVIMAVPTYSAAGLLGDVPAAKWLERIPYVSVANIALAFDRKDITHPLEGSGFVVPRKEGRTITACSWISSKWLHTAPEGKILLRAYVGHLGSQEWVHYSDEQLLSKVRKDLLDIMDIAAEPTFYEITRWHQSMPQYPVGHVEQLKVLREELFSQKPGLFLCGAGYQGVGIPDCVQQGKNAAQQLLNYYSV